MMQIDLKIISLVSHKIKFVHPAAETESECMCVGYLESFETVPISEGVTPQIVHRIQTLLKPYSGCRGLVLRIQQIQQIVHIFTNLCILNGFGNVL